MNGIVAFDAKDFSRGKYIEEPHPTIKDQKIRKFLGFYSPLGCGISVNHPDVLKKAM